MKPILVVPVLMLVMISPASAIDSVAPQLAVQSMNLMPLTFTKNNGQWDSRVLYRSNAGGAAMWFTKEGVTYQFLRGLHRSGAPTEFDSPQSQQDQIPDSVEQLVLRASFVGSNPNPEIVGEGLLEYKCNYFIGNDPAQWRTDVSNYGAIVVKNIYDGIDVRYHSDGGGKMMYDFVLAPGADPTKIKVAYDGVDEMSIDHNGRVFLKTMWGDLIATIESLASRQNFSSAVFTQLSNETIGFEDAGLQQQQQTTLSLGLVFSSYLRGIGGFDYGDGVAVDAANNVYVAGSTGSANFPTQSPYQATSAGGYFDAFITKLSSSGGSLIYSTYLGGSDMDLAFEIAIDGSGNAYVTGETMSSNFPTMNPFQTNQDTSDVFVTKLGISGNTLIYSTYLGGSGRDAGYSIAVDGSDCAYVTGETISSNFPTQSPFQTAQGNYDAFVTKLSSAGNDLVYSTNLGKGDYDGGTGIAVDAGGNTYVTGYTHSSNFPTLNPFQTYQGGYDAFVTKLSSFGNTLIYSTYLGGSSDDWSYAIGIDATGSTYVTGETFSSSFPIHNSYQATWGPWLTAFVTKLNSSGSSLSYSTFLGGGGSPDGGHGIAVDNRGNAYVTGVTHSPGFPTQNPYQTWQGLGDAFVTMLTGSGGDLIYSTFLGGSDSDRGEGIAVDGSGNIYVTGQTYSPNFPTQDPYQTYQGPTGFTDAFVTKLTGCGGPDDDGDEYPSSCDNCPLTSNTDQMDTNADGVGDACQDNSSYTQTGSVVVVSPVPGVTLTFNNVASPGVTQVTTNPTGDPPPTGFVIFPVNPPTYYEINSNASFGGQVTVCLTYNPGQLGSSPESSLRLFHLPVGSSTWQDVTVSQDLTNHIVCGSVSSLSPFIMARPFVCGDANGSGAVSISDVVTLINYIFSGGPAPNPLASGDANCSGGVNISDAVYLINYIFSGGAAPCAACP